MRKITILFSIMLLSILTGVVIANYLRPPAAGPTHDQTVQIPRPVRNGNDVELKSETATVKTNGTSIETALNALMKTADDGKGASAIPSGTKIESVKIENGTAIIDLSKEFMELNKHGDDSESLAQNAIRKILSPFPEILRMNVRVEGKVFEGEHNGPWTDIPVRDENARSGDAP